MRKLYTMYVMIPIVTVLLVAGFTLFLINSVFAAQPCTGGIYENHPGLQVECLHQNSVNHGDDPYPAPYPAPVDPIPTFLPMPTDDLPKPFEPTPTSPSYDLRCFILPGVCPDGG